MTRVVLVMLASLILTRSGGAAEGAASNYFPGSYGSFGVALAPEPGFVAASYTLFYGADAERSVLQGRVNTSVDTFAAIEMIAGFYTFESEVLGARLATAAFVPFGYVELDGRLGTVSVEADEFQLGDMSVVPASLYWSFGNLHLNVYELIFIPTGPYDVDRLVNVGRNYWSFDTVFAATWFDADWGTELSAVVGVLANTKNPDTDYQTGAEFHLDLMLNQFLAETFALGLHGYYYDQLTGDSGSGAALGSFESLSIGIGPAALWQPQRFDGRLALQLSWLHDLDAENRIEADYVVFTASWAF